MPSFPNSKSSRQLILQPKTRILAPDPVYTRQPPASPVHLSSSLVLRSGGSGSVNSAALKNPMGQDMELLEIKFELSAVNSAGAQILGATIACELTMGSVKLTNGSIPVWNFGRVENLAADSSYTDTAGSGTTFCLYSWRLPRPLFIPAGAVVVPTFVHNGMVTNAINVRVGYSARTVFRKPKKVYVPWVAKYASKVFNPISSAGTDLSSELDLVNSNPEVLHLQRFVGRVLNIQATETTEVGNAAFYSQYLTLRMTDSYGRPIVRSFTPFGSVFTRVTRSWEMDNGAELDPEAFYRVELKKDTMSLDGASSSVAGQAFISMVGWREMEMGGLS